MESAEDNRLMMTSLRAGEWALRRYAGIVKHYRYERTMRRLVIHVAPVPFWRVGKCKKLKAVVNTLQSWLPKEVIIVVVTDRSHYRR